MPDDSAYISYSNSQKGNDAHRVSGSLLRSNEQPELTSHKVNLPLDKPPVF
jgi:hypothetical protein